MVGISLEVVCLTGIWRSNPEIGLRGSTGNLLIWMACSGDFLLIEEKIFRLRPKKIITLRVMTFIQNSPGGIRTCDQSINSRPLYR